MNLMVRSVGGGLVASLLSLAYAFSYGALIFVGPLQPFLGQGVAAALITTVVTTMLIALTSGFRCAVAGPDSNTSALLAGMMVVMAPTLSALPPERALAVAVTGLCATTLITGAILFLFGWGRLGNLVRFVPYPVMAGFLVSTGWLMTVGSIHMSTGIPLSLVNLGHFTEFRAAFPLLATIAWGVTLWLLMARFRSPLILPLALMSATVAVHIILWLIDLPAATIDDLDLMFSLPKNSAAVFPLLDGNQLLSDLSLLTAVLGNMAAVAVMAILTILLNSTSIELATSERVDLDRELRVQGLANVAAASMGGFVGHISVSRTLLSRAAGGVSRISSVTVGLVALAVLVGGGDIVGVIPRFILGGLLLQLGICLIWDWGVASRRKLPLQDWLIVVGILLITAWFGFLPALLFGVLASCVIFTINVSRIRVIRHQFGLDERTSSRLRSFEEMAVLSRHGSEARLLKLSGYLFFGSAYSLQEQVKQLIESQPLRILIFDFSDVTGVDSSTVASFTKISEMARQADIALIIVADDGSALPGARHETSPDHALEAAENDILSHYMNSNSKTEALADWLTRVMGRQDLASELMKVLHPAACDAEGYLCRQGENTDTLLFIERGPVNVMIERPGQSPLRIRAFGSHCLAGEIGFFLETPRSASLVAAPEAIVWALDRSSYHTLANSRPEFLAALLTYVIRLQSERLTFDGRQIDALRR